MKFFKYIFATAILLSTLPLAGQNGWNTDAQTCKDKSGDEAIAACTRAIQSGQLTQHNLAVTYMNRGVEMRNKGLVDSSIADYNEALRLDPNYAMPYNDRGNSWLDKGDIDKALSDFNDAIRINPNYAKAYGNRATAWMIRQQYDRAIDDYRQSIRLQTTDSYRPLLLVVAQMHKGNVDYTAELGTNTATFNQDWPMPIVQFYMGKMTQADLEATGKSLDGENAHSCELSFYIGEWQLSHGQRAQGIANLKTAKSTCNDTYSEYLIAVYDLKQWQ